MADMTVWYVAILAGATLVILGVRLVLKNRNQMHQGKPSLEEGAEGVETK